MFWSILLATPWKQGALASSPGGELPPSSSLSQSISQATLSEEKRSLIFELLEITGGQEQYEQVQQILFAQVQSQLPLLLEQTIRGSDNFSPEEEEAAIAAATANLSTLIADFGRLMQAEISYDEIVEKVYYPVYDQYFSEEDLRNLIAFYQTPTGTRLVEVSPDLYQTSLELSNEILLPKMLGVLNQLLQEQFNQVQGPVE